MQIDFDEGSFVFLQMHKFYFIWAGIFAKALIETSFDLIYY